MDLRCDNSLLGVLDLESGVLEISCKSRFCGKRPGVTVVHRIDLSTGQVISTRSFRTINKGEESHGGS